MRKIFISYRREDSADVTGRITDRLREKFGEEAVFTDVDGIPIGVDFREYLDREVGQCDIFLAVMGPYWLSIEDDNGRRRLDDPSDFVRIEVESALNRRIPVVPLLAHGMSMPSASELPDSISELAFRNGVPVRRDPDFHSDMDRIISGIEKHFPQGEEDDKKDIATELEAPGNSPPGNADVIALGQQVDRSIEASAAPPASSSIPVRSFIVTATLVLAVVAGGWWYNEKISHDSETARIRQEADVEVKHGADTEARRLAEAEAKRKADVEARRLAEAEARRKADAEAKQLADAEAKRKADAEARRLAEAEAKRQADAEARRLAEAEAKRQADAEARQLADAQAKRRASAEVKRIASTETAGKKMFSKQETIEFISGKTVFWEDGNGAFYSPDGKLYTKWSGETETGRWSVTDDGAVCWHVPSWGNDACESYYLGPDGLMAVYKGETSPADVHRVGNHLDSLY